MSSKQGGSDNNNCDCGYDAGNKRHKLSYWEGRADPRDKDGIYFEILFLLLRLWIDHIFCQQKNMTDSIATIMPQWIDKLLRTMLPVSVSKFYCLCYKAKV